MNGERENLLDESSSETETNQGDVNSRRQKTDLNYVAVLPAAEQYDPAAPAVLLFGWAGCVDRNLAKYSQIYEQIGCTTFRYTAPMTIFHHGDGGKEVAAALCSAVNDELDIGGSPSILVHTFSNNGARLLAMMLHELNSTQKYSALRSKITGLVFDCGPADGSVWTFARATIYSAKPLWAGWKHYLASALCYAVFGVAYAFRTLYRWATGSRLQLAGQDSGHAGLWSLIDQLPSRQTFLYSKADKMCHYLSIEKFIAEQKCRSGDRKQIEFQCFEKAAHCDLLRSNAHDYRQALTQIVNDLKLAGGTSRASTSSTPPTTDDGFEAVDASKL